MNPSSQLLPKVISRILQLSPCPHTSLSVYGWIKSIRKQKHIAFLELIDGSGPHHLQVVLSPQLAHALETGTALRVDGMLVESRGGKQNKELKCESLEVLGSCPMDSYPLQKKDHSVGFLRSHSHLRPRTTTTAAVLRLRSAMAHQASSHLHSLDFHRTEPPIITFGDCEGAGEVFRIQAERRVRTDLKPSQPDSDFFGQPAYLTVSAQLHLEALAAGLGRVYSLGPAFRAESSQTNRHMAEFWMLEAEVSFCESLDQLTCLTEDLLCHVLKSVDEEANVVRKLLGDETRQASTTSARRWPRLTYTEAVKLIQDHRGSTSAEAHRLPDLKWGEALRSEHEKWIAGTYFEGPVFVTDYPARLKPFYMQENARDDQGLMMNEPTVACFDLLVPKIGELVGGSLRESKESKLRAKMMEKGMNVEGYDWYLDLRRFGSVPHGGFGIGWDRLVCWITGLEHVKESIGFPRVVGGGGGGGGGC